MDTDYSDRPIAWVEFVEAIEGASFGLGWQDKVLDCQVTENHHDGAPTWLCLTILRRP